MLKSLSEDFDHMIKGLHKIRKNFIVMGIILALVGLFLFVGAQGVKPVKVLDGEQDCVVLLHGLGRSSFAMEKLAKNINGAGFKTVNVDYPSTKYSIKDLEKEFLSPAISNYCSDVDERIHFVTHSFGGILVRYYLANNELDNLGNVIMIAAPNKGSEVADLLSNSGVARFVMGSVLSDLVTDSSGVLFNLPEPDYDVYVIAGNKSVNPIFSMLIPGEDDGKVSVESTKLKNMKDFLLVSENHTFIMKSDQVAEAVKNFLKE